MKVGALESTSTQPERSGGPMMKPSCFTDIDSSSARRRKRLCVASFCLFFATVGSIAFGIAYNLRRKSPKTLNYRWSNATAGVRGPLVPTTLREAKILKIITVEFGDDYLNDISSTQHQALNWLMRQDSYQIDADSENLIQRYVMTAFYAQTSQEGRWKSCNPPQDKQSDACYHFYLTDTSKHPWRYRETIWTRWLSGLHECEWAGVTCYSDKVTGISLNGYSLSGNLPTELARLDNLTQLSLTHNSIGGSLPTDIGAMKNLTQIELQNNALDGSIPVEFFNAESLLHVNLGSNQLTGTIPKQVELLSNLGLLFLHHNKLSGNLTKELFGVESLEWLFLGNNKFSGELPTDVGRLTNMAFLYAEGNPLTGTLPSELGLLTSMREVDLHNTLIGGTIPDEIYQGMYQYLNMIDLSNSRFSGSISTHIGRFKTLDWFLLGNNNINGTIPEELALVTSLRRLELQGNHLLGSMPHEVCYFDDLGSLMADCSALETGDVPVDCPCCTSCCNQDTGICLPQ